MNSRPFRPLRRKLLLPTILTATFILALISFGIILIIYHLVELRLNERAESIISGILSATESVDDSSQLQRIVSAVAAEPGVELVIIVAGQEPRVIACSQHRWLGKKLSELPLQNIGKDLKNALESRNSSGGRLHATTDLFDLTIFCRPILPSIANFKPTDVAIMVHLNGRNIKAELRWVLLSFEGCAIAALVITLALSYWLLARNVLKPIARIRDQLPRLNADIGEIDINHSHNDEIGDLVESLNRTTRDRRMLGGRLEAEGKSAAEQISRLFKELKDIRRAVDEHSIIATTDTSGVITQVNEKFSQVSGYSKRELIGQTHRLVNSGYHPRAFFASMWKTISRGHVWKGVVKNRAKNGSYYWVNTTIFPILDEASTPVRYIAIRTDITALKNAEESLRASETKFRRLWESSRDAQFLCFPPEWKLAGGNAAAVALYGARDAAHLATLHPAELSPERQPDGELSSAKSQQMIGQALDKGVNFFEWMHRKIDGTEVPCEVTLIRITLNGLTGVQAAVRDITKRKAAEAALRRTRDSLAKAQEVGQIGSFEYFPATNTLECSAEKMRIFGLNPDGPAPTFDAVMEMMLPEDRAPALASFEAFLQDRGPSQWEYRIVLPDGDIRHMSTRAEKVLDEHGELRCVIGTTLDITERQQMTEQLRRRLAERETLLQEVHHRVKNNLQVITSLLAMQQRRATSAEVAAEFQTSHDRIAAIALIHEQLYGTHVLDRVDLSKFIRQLGMNILQGGNCRDRIVFEVKGGTFSLDLQMAVPCALLLNELIANALKHAFPDDRRGRIEVELKLDADGARHIYVRDDGVGMAAELAKGMATSLGLRLVNRLVDQMDAKMELLAQTPGTQYHILLPAAKKV